MCVQVREIQSDVDPVVSSSGDEWSLRFYSLTYTPPCFPHFTVLFLCLMFCLFFSRRLKKRVNTLPEEKAFTREKDPSWDDLHTALRNSSGKNGDGENARQAGRGVLKQNKVY